MSPAPPSSTTFQICAVCGAQCNRKSYGVPSCDGCRHFFRRTIVNKKTLHCSNGRECAIERGDCCRSCRLDKCILVGMDWAHIKVAECTAQSDSYGAFLERRKRQLVQRQHSTSPPIVKPLCLTDAHSSDASTLDYLLDLGVRRSRIWHSFGELSARFKVDKYRKLEELLESGDNLLARADTFSPNPRRLSQKEMDAYLDELEHSEFVHPKMIQAVLTDRLLVISVAKALPAFARLSLQDKVTLIRNVFAPVTFFGNLFYSTQMGSDTAIRADGSKTVCIFQTSRYCGDPQLATLVDRNFTRPLQPFLRNPITAQEFILCLAIIHSHSGIVDLSPSAKELLYAESSRYATMLLKYLQSRYGSSGGIGRFANCMLLIANAFRCAHHKEQLDIYVEVFHHLKNIAIVFPDCLKTVI